MVYFGSLDGAIHTITADNPGAVLLNPGCSARFEADLEALAVDHTRRNVHGGATGDLNRDGFPDLVTASAFDVPAEIPLKRYPVEYGSLFDATAVSLGRARTATVEVLWPGGTVGRLDGVRAGERIVFPEIPCDPRVPSAGGGDYRACVADALEALEERGLVSASLAGRLLGSAPER